MAACRSSIPDTAPWRVWLRHVACLLLLCACDDPQQRALNDVAKRGYSLSVAEFHRAAEKGDVGALESFLAAGTAIDVADAEGVTALSSAIAAKQGAAADFLIGKGCRLTAAPAAEASTLLLAASAGDAALVTKLLPAHRPKQVVEALLAATRQGHFDAVTTLLRDAKSQLRPHTAPALLLAAENGHIDCMDALLQAGADADMHDSTTGMTPLHLAAKSGHLEAVRLLLRNGADLFALTQEGKTVWETGAEALPADIAALLAEADQALAASPPPPRITDAQILGTLILTDTHLTELPFRFTDMDGRAAVLQMNEGGPALHVRPGEQIGTTPWQLVELRTASPALPAALQPALFISDSRDGRRHLLIRGRAAYGTPLAATVQVTGTETSYEARPGDVFSLQGEKVTVQSVTRDHLVLVDIYGATKEIAW